MTFCPPCGIILEQSARAAEKRKVNIAGWSSLVARRVISQYETGYKNIRVIPYSQYTDELGAAHGEFTLSREYIESMLRSTIDEEFLTLD